jgi:ribosomal protein S14
MKKSITSSRSSTARAEDAPRKLALARETLRRLSASELAGVVGGEDEGRAQITDSCVTCGTNC